MMVTRYEAVDRGGLYNERIDRNIGWVTPEQQEVLRRTTVGVAGNGGMGGLIAATMLRSGFSQLGEIRICDDGVFDASNMNRQFGARFDTIRKNKALVTADELRRICDDTAIVVDQRGITPESVQEFVQGCGVIFDEIEFFALSARFLLHQVARALGVAIINCNTVGYGTRMFFFTPTSMSIEEMFDLTYEQALDLETRAKAGSKEAIETLIEKVMSRLVPELPSYGPGGHEAIYARLRQGKAPICGTNPPMATGCAADRALLYLLRNAGIDRPEMEPAPEMPGYLYFDAYTWKSKPVTERWW